MLSITVVYARPEHAILIPCQVKEPCSVESAIIQSGILTECHLTLTSLAVGIYGQRVELSTRLADGDRIELYRALINDPKAIRRQRAAHKLTK